MGSSIKKRIGSKLKIKTSKGEYIDGILKSIIKRNDGRKLFLLLKQEWHLINEDMIEEIEK